MEKIIYSKDITKEDLLKRNIVISDDVEIGENVVLGFNVSITKRSKIASGCEIGTNSVIENALIGKDVKILSSYITDSKIGNNTTVGPFAHIRQNSVVGNACRIGNFVETKNSVVGDECKIAHLTYVGDAIMGKNCNIGCGVVFCNYNGQIKQKSILGNNVFVGSNVNLVAPLKIEDNSYIAAGSTITMNVAEEEFAIARAFQINKKDFHNPYIEHMKNK